MVVSALERHELAGLDDRERGFSRMADLHAESQRFVARLSYERTLVMGESSETPGGAVVHLVHALHAHGYRQIRSRRSFKGEEYLGSQEPWVEYPDPPPTPRGVGALLERVMGWFRK